MEITLSNRLFRILLLVFVFANFSCSQKGLISEKHPEYLYSVPKLIKDGSYKKNPTFIFYGDVRPGFRGREMFLREKNWYNWKIFIEVVSFYFR